MEKFSFPFQPYDIQLKLMTEIKKCIEDGKVGIFESPTGTGKSLSVLCSTMTWLEEEESRKENELRNLLKETKEKIEEANGMEDWIKAHEVKMKARKMEDTVIDEIHFTKRVKDRIELAKNGTIEVSSRKRKIPNSPDQILPIEEEHDELAPSEEYSSDCEIRNEEDEEEKELHCVKIYYASRTHSQLEQLVEELEKTRFRPRIVTCASRSTLCVNDNVRKLKLNHLINEKCMELRKSSCGEKRSKGEKEGKKIGCSGTCEYYNSNQIEDLVNGILANKFNTTLKLTKQGRQSIGCPYFATRKSIPLCQLVLLPYQVLLHDGTRDAWGVKLEGNVVILDEAHNVLNTIGSLYSAEISGKSLSVALKLIREYIETYRLRLKSKNLLYMRQLENLASSMLGFVSRNECNDEVLTIPELVGRLNIFEINLFKLAAYIEKTDLCKKFHGFYVRVQRNVWEEIKKENEKPKLSGIARLMAKNEENAGDSIAKRSENPETAPIRAIPSPLFSLKSFIDAMTNKCEDGRIVVEKRDAKLRYILLNPAQRLAEVVDSARATILVGGTMEPAELLVETLTKGNIGVEDIRRFSCKHVIDPNQLMAVVVENTVDGKPFQLTYQTRNNDTVLKSLALSLNTLISHLPNGVVVFLPSYDFLYMFQRKLNEFGIMKKIEEKKNVFTESRLPTSDVWEKYSRAAKTTKGAMLFAVVGGKMSEGINFCDELGRAVIVVGLPYPNKTSVELKEKMRFLDSQIKNGGSLLYESLCMHAVNQAIGRAIRHRHDYAAVYLFDERYSKLSTRSKLSSWIGERTETGVVFGEIIRKSKEFFTRKIGSNN